MRENDDLRIIQELIAVIRADGRCFHERMEALRRDPTNPCHREICRILKKIAAAR